MTQLDVEAIAARVAELVHDRVAAPTRYVDTATAARMLSVSEDWVRRHAAELGGVRVGNSRSGPLRFDVRRIEASMERWRIAGPRRRRRVHDGRRRRRSPIDVELLPLPGRGDAG